MVGAIQDLVPLAPLHNPANLLGIKVTRELRPDVPHVAVFATAFPRHAAARHHHIRRYGFHRTSCRYVTRRTARLLGRPVEELDLVVLHLGDGDSATALQGGRER